MKADGDVVVQPGFVIPASELTESASRAGGPGGQHVNKTSSRITLRWNVAESSVPSDAQRERLLQRLRSRITNDGELVLHVDGTRSQLVNREAARERLAEVVAAALHVPRARRKTRPTRGSVRRRLDAKKRRGDIKKNRRRPPG